MAVALGLRPGGTRRTATAVRMAVAVGLDIVVVVVVVVVEKRTPLQRTLVCFVMYVLFVFV